MPDKETALLVARISQEFCNVLPKEAVLFFAEGLRRRHNSVPDHSQRYLDALANLVQGFDIEPPPKERPKLRIVKGGAA
jgi:hypothetical protein